MKNTTVERLIKFMNVAPKNSAHTNICGIMFKAGRMYAANGPVACSVELIDEQIEGFLPYDKFDVVKAMYKGQKKNDTIVGVTELLVKNEGYPANVEQFFPSNVNFKIAFNVKLLFNLFKALDDRENSKSIETLILSIDGEHKPIGVETLGGNKGIIMPVRV